MANQNEKEPERHVHAPVAEGKIVEKSKFQKAIGIFLEEDATDIKTHVNDYIEERAKSFGKEMKRKAKEFILDNINGAAEIMLFGKGRRSGNGDSSTYKSGTYNGQNVVYTSYYTGDGSSSATKVQDNREVGTRLKIITLPSYGKAEDVKGEILSLSKRYPNVSVGDYYQLCGIAPAKEDFNFGWKKEQILSSPIEIVYSAKAEGYQLILPRPVSLI